MTRKTLTSLLVFISLIVIGQKKIENKLTDAHQNIKGTKISLVPPNGFTESLNFLGLQQAESGSSIILLDFPGPYAEISKGLTKESMLSKGIEAKKIENLMINSLPALFVTGTQKAYGNLYTKYILVFGTNNETIMIHGVHPLSLKKIGKEIEKSLLTVYYEADKKLNPFEVLDYTIDVSDTKLKFANSMSNAIVFSVDGQMPTGSNDKTNLIVTKSFSEINTEDKKLFCLNRLKQLPIEITNIAYTKAISIDGIWGYEIYAKGKNNKTAETENIYQVILFSNNLYYILLGTTNNETDDSIEEIKNAILTFKRK